MKSIIFLSFICMTALVQAQDFKTDVATAKSAYSAGKLEDAHFALQQMLQELDITIGKEVIKLLPATFNKLNVIEKDDNVTGNVGFIGSTIHRSYGADSTKASIEIVSNSPLIGTLNAFLNTPFLAGLGSDGKTKVVKVQGYKARLTKEENTENKKISYRLEIPFSNSLITCNADDITDTDMLAMGNALPLAQIAKLIQ